MFILLLNKEVFMSKRNSGGPIVKFQKSSPKVNLPMAAAVADVVIEKFIPDYKDQVRNAGMQYARKQAGKIGSRFGFTPKGNDMANPYSYFNSNSSSPRDPNKGPYLSPSGQFVFKSSPANPSNSSYALSPAPKPRAISLNSRIKPNTYVNDYMTPIEGNCSPLHMSGVKLAIPTVLETATHPLAQYFDKTICFDIQTRAQAAVGFGVDISNILTSANLGLALNDAIFALQVYFYYSSILSYESDTRNKNSGMIALRSTIDATIMSDLVQLGKRLEDICVPPKVVEWVRFMMGNYLSGDTQGAPIIKLFSNPQMVYGTPASPSFPAVALAQLAGSVNPYNDKVFTLLRRCIPKWRVGPLYDFPCNPVYDKNFLTIFANLTNQNRGPAGTTSPNIFLGSVTGGSAIQSTVPYCSYHNNLDGLSYAMASIYDNTANMYYPGFVRSSSVTVVYPDNRYSYYSVSGVKGFYPVSQIPFLAVSRPETNIVIGTTVYSTHLPGTDRCQIVSGNSVIQTGQSLLDFLFESGKYVKNGTVKQFAA